MKQFLLVLLRTILRILRPNSGLTRIVYHPFTRWLFGASPGVLMTRIPERTTIELDLNEFNGRKLWLCAANDWKIVRTVRALQRSGDAFLDIGANYGSVGFSIVRRIAPQGEVHFFEPQPLLADHIEAAITRNTVPNAHIHRVALFERDGIAALQIPSDHSGAASLLEDASGDASQTVNVETRATYPFVAELLKSRSFGVKIDIEGAEPHVLPDLLRFEGLRFVVFEGNRNADILFDLFTSAQFDIFGLCQTVLRPRISPVTSAEEMRQFHDLVALPHSTTLPRRDAPLTTLAKALRTSS